MRSIAHPRAAAVSIRVDDQVEGPVILKEGHPLLGLGCLQQRPDQLPAGPVVGVNDAVVCVAALASQRQLAVLLPGEPCAHCEQILHSSGGFANRRLDHCGVAQPGTRVQRVLDMRLDRVVGAKHRGDAPLGVARIRFRRRHLGDDGNRRAASCGVDRKIQASHAAADAQIIGLMTHIL